MLRLEVAPLLFTIGRPDEIAEIARDLRTHGDQFHFARRSQAEMAGLLGFLEGTMSEADLLRPSVTSPIERCRFESVVGWKRLGGGDRTGSGAAFQRAYEAMRFGSLSWSLARAVLIRMRKEPGWPRAIPIKK